jgi:hypothetical protein
LPRNLWGAKLKRSGGQKGRGLGGNFCPPPLSAASFFATEIFRANEIGAPPIYK